VYLGKVVKDLSVLKIDLKDIIILDNTPSSYLMQKSNGIPIKTWMGEKSDSQLAEISKILELLSDVDDVREYIPLFTKNDSLNITGAINIIQQKKESINTKKQLYEKVEPSKFEPSIKALSLKKADQIPQKENPLSFSTFISNNYQKDLLNRKEQNKIEELKANTVIVSRNDLNEAFNKVEISNPINVDREIISLMKQIIYKNLNK